MAAVLDWPVAPPSALASGEDQTAIEPGGQDARCPLCAAREAAIAAGRDPDTVPPCPHDPEPTVASHSPAQHMCRHVWAPNRLDCLRCGLSQIEMRAYGR